MTYKHLGEYIRFVCATYQSNICVKDFVGFIPINKELEKVLTPYLAHTNPYCMYIKQEKKMYQCCISMIPPLYKKCASSDDYFFGVCHAGVFEYVVPIKIDGVLLGSVNASYLGQFRGLSYRMIKRLFRNDKAGLRRALQLFDSHIPTGMGDIETLLPGLRLIAEYLAMTYIGFKSSHVVGNLNDLNNFKDNPVITQALEFISHNYSAQITVKQIAQSCHCSESYINHTFNKSTGVNVNTYINKVRIEHAKNYLLTSSDSITVIALNVGFSDPNYFSKVFSSMLGITATEFRKRYTT